MKLKKLVAAMLSVMTFTMLVQPCFAVTVNELIEDFPQSVELQLEMGVSAKRSEGGDYEAGGLLIQDIVSAQSVDYIASLNMQPIRDVFSNTAMAFLANSDDDELRNEFLNGSVTTEITVVIDYPDTAETSSDFRNKGALVSDNNIFEEKSREVDETEKRAIIRFKNRDNTKVKNLIDNKDTYFEDLYFELKNEIKYSKAGTHTVSITLSGSTTIDFASRDQIFQYNGQSSHIVTITTKMDEENHVLKVVPAVPPTCFEDGQTESVICSVHNKYCMNENGTKYYNGIKYFEVIPKLNHEVMGVSKKMHIDGVDASCVAEGIVPHWTCILCKSDFTSQDSDVVVPHENHIIPLRAHTPQIIAGVPASCNTHGYRDGSFCTVCGLVLQYSELIPATGNHTLVNIKTPVAVDCETTGVTAGSKCSVCNTVVEESITIPATGHNYGEWVVTTPATDTAEGSKERTCQNNPAHKEVVTIPKTQHVHSINPSADVIITPATCKKEGKKQQYCSCGEAIGNAIAIPKLEHALTHVDAIAATCVSKGNIEYWVCGRQGCGKTFRDQEAKYEVNSVKINKDKENHAEIITIPGIAPTCGIEGLTEGEKCKACNKIIVKQKSIAKIPCQELSRIEEVPAECEKNGVKLHWHCNVCNRDFGNAEGTIVWKEKDYVISATGHNYKPAEKINPDEVADEDGNFSGKRVCRNDATHTEYLKIHAPDNCDHKISEVVDGEIHYIDKIYEIVVKEPTCLEDGKAKKICHLCAYVSEDNIRIPKIKHDLEYIATVNATCYKLGTEAHYKCRLCDKLFDAKDSTKEINAPKKTAKITEHAFEDRSDVLKVCKFCGEEIHVQKKDKDGNVVTENGASLEKPAHIKDGDSEEEIEENKKVDEIREERKNAVVDNYVIFEQKEEVSKKLDESIQAKAQANNSEVKKLVYDIDVEKVTTYITSEGQDKNIQDIKETDDLITIRIEIPEDFRDSLDVLVHREHEGSIEIIQKKKNEFGEYIEIADDKSYVILYVKRFSEYAVVAYNKVVSDPDDQPESSLGAGTSLATPKYTVKFNANGGIKIDDKKVDKGATIVLLIAVREGYVFAGWYTDNEFKNKFDPNTKIENNLTLYAKWIECVLNSADHIAYVMGYPAVGGVEEVRPENNITREEIATIFYRLLRSEAREKLHTTSNNFSDVKADRWSNEYISTMANGGYVNGYEDGSFKPAGAITRAEFVTIATRLYGSEEGVAESDVEFADVNGHWATRYIDFATSAGWIDGYDDGTFKPNKSITRAEVMKIVNNMLNRHVDEEGLVDGVKHWVDNKSGAWYYYDVLEATNAHNYVRDNGVITETWTSLVK